MIFVTMLRFMCSEMLEVPIAENVVMNKTHILSVWFYEWLA